MGGTKQVSIMNGEKFNLKWDDFSHNLVSSLKHLNSGAKYSDVTLASGDEFFEVHKLVLSASSPVFEKLMDRLGTQVSLVYLQGVNPKSVQSMINFIYFGEVSLYQEELESFLQVGEDFQIRGLTKTENSD